ncbi:MAG TPA: M14 family zinc carboxypeptidase [Candidatus Acidoferrales bacterium]|nr:M14 family zinc carboxypeptidase [Candidatus Acidoferrales bacterium]
MRKMNSFQKWAVPGILLLFALIAFCPVLSGADDTPGRDPKQPVDEDYTQKILKYTTGPNFISPLVNYLPASKTVPTPEAVLGDIAGAPGNLPHSKEVYEYMRMLEKASPRVKVFSIGHTEEGREMIAVAISSDSNIAHLDQNRAMLAQLADPRAIHLDDAVADKIAGEAVPVYYITGTIHSTETGAPTALMEMAYRLAVDDSQYIRDIRDHVITLITPIVEVDGRDRMADLNAWHLAHPKENYSPLIYWGHYVGHDNNRDAMGMTLKLSQNVLNTFVGQDAQVLHDLHESVAFLYDNTAGDGPFNAWVDPILANEWEIIAWRNVQDMTKFGMPGVFTHGDFDTWSPGYLMFFAALHNGISRLYETFGNAVSDTETHELSPDEYSRTWYRQNPPLPVVTWSLRDNNNYEQTGLLTSLHFFSDNRVMFLKNFYLKAKRSVQKPEAEGPAAYVLPSDDPRLGAQSDLLRVLQLQHCEISRATAAFSVTEPVKKSDEHAHGASSPAKEGEKPATETKTINFPSGSYIIRMDQPYSRIADALLDYQYWSPEDPQKTPYDDTGWTFGELFGVKVARITDAKVLDAPMERVASVEAPSGVSGSGSVFAINDNADNSLATLRYKLKDASIDVAEEPFESAGRKFNRGSFLIHGVSGGDLQQAIGDLGLKAYGLGSAPSVKTHPVRAARIAILHTWLSTQTEGWWREALDFMHIPYAYINTQTVSKNDDLNAKYDVILFPPVGRFVSPDLIINGVPTDWGNPLPWKTTDLTPNIGELDSTDDIRPGLGWSGAAHLQDFVKHGGILVTVDDTANLAISLGLTRGVTVAHTQHENIVGSVVRADVVDPASPIAYGYGDKLSVYTNNGPAFDVSDIVGRGRFRRLRSEIAERATGRGTLDDPDFVVGRKNVAPAEHPHADPWQAEPLTEDQLRNGIGVIPPALRPRVIFRYADNKDLLVSGLVEGGDEIAQHPMVVDVPMDTGHVVLFSNNPVYRGETLGSYSLVLNTILNFDHLDAGRKLDKQ